MTLGLMGVPEYRELAENLDTIEGQLADVQDAFERYSDPEAARWRAVQALDWPAVDAIEGTLDFQG
jgi:hypothetical protein